MTTARMRGAVLAGVRAFGIRGTDLHVPSDPTVASLRSSSAHGLTKLDPPALHASEGLGGVVR